MTKLLILSILVLGAGPEEVAVAEHLGQMVRTLTTGEEPCAAAHQQDAPQPPKVIERVCDLEKRTPKLWESYAQLNRDIETYQLTVLGAEDSAAQTKRKYDNVEALLKKIRERAAQLELSTERFLDDFDALMVSAEAEPKLARIVPILHEFFDKRHGKLRAELPTLRLTGAGMPARAFAGHAPLMNDMNRSASLRRFLADAAAPNSEHRMLEAALPLIKQQLGTSCR